MARMAIKLGRVLVSALPTDQGGRMSYDPVGALRAAGHPIDVLSTSQRDVLSGLSEQEVTTLNSIKERLDAAGGGEIEGQHNFIIV